MIKFMIYYEKRFTKNNEVFSFKLLYKKKFV